MSAETEKQAIAARIAGAIKKGLQKGKPGEASSQMAKMPMKSLKKFMHTKKDKKENMGVVPPMYVVRKPHADMKEADLVMELNPLEGIQPLNIEMGDVHSVHATAEDAQAIAAEAYKKCMDEALQLEEKKGKVGDKIKKAIDQLEKKRKEHMDMAKEDPKQASKHKEHIAKIAQQIDDLMTKMEKIEKSKKEIKKEEDNINESVNEVNEPGSPERLLLTIKNQAIALINAARKALDNSDQPPYFDTAKKQYVSGEIDNVTDNLTFLINVCHHFIPEDSNNLQTVRSMKLAIAKRGDQKMNTPPPMPSKKALPIPGVTGKSNLGRPPVSQKPPVPNK